MHEVIKKCRLTPDTVSLEIRAPEIAARAEAGQFVVVRMDEPGERIPLTVADFDRERGNLVLVVQEAGFSTGMLARMEAGDALLDVAGPLGKPTKTEKHGTVLCVGGGVGIAPLFPISRAFRESGNRVVAVLAARRGDLVFWEDRFRKAVDEVHVYTDDGSRGKKGLATDALNELVSAGENPGLVVAVGPVVMMKFVAAATRKLGIKTIVSLNPIMIDGTGMCGGCRVESGGRTYFACVDGPEFDGHQVDFNLLMDRQSYYRDQEKRCREHGCRLEGSLE